MSTISLYLVVAMKGGEVLFATHGPFLDWDTAYVTLQALPKMSGRCYQEVAEVTLLCKVEGKE